MAWISFQLPWQLPKQDSDVDPPSTNPDVVHIAEVDTLADSIIAEGSWGELWSFQIYVLCCTNLEI